jgi:carbon-monoxide dehydrogenase large subunit
LIGARLPRLDDGRLLRGQGRFVDDISVVGTLHAAFVRSPHPHALIRGIDKRAALAAPGVHAVFTLADLMPPLNAERLPLQFRSAQLPPDVTPFALAKDEVAFAGEAVAAVIADARHLAEDAAALVAVDFEPLPSVSDCRAALAPGAPLAHRQRKSNLLLEIRQGYGDIAAAFARAPHRLSLSLKQHRGGAHSI